MIFVQCTNESCGITIKIMTHGKLRFSRHVIRLVDEQEIRERLCVAGCRCMCVRERGTVSV